MSAADRKKAIVHAAMPLFAKKGFSGTKTLEIAKAAGVSEALLYRHFPSKESLYQEIFTAAGASSALRAGLLESLPPSTESLVFAVYAFHRPHHQDS